MTSHCQPDQPPQQPTRTPRALYLLLALVAGAAGMLSFAALRDLALLCGFGQGLAWLLPVVVDAGAAAGSLVWLAPTTSGAARVFARRLALGLLGLSVAANALGHGLAAYHLAPPWWVVVALSGIAPAVLGAMVHLAVLVGRHPEHQIAPDEMNDEDHQATGQETADWETAEQDPAGVIGADGFPWTGNASPALAPTPRTLAPWILEVSSAVEPLTLPAHSTDPADDTPYDDERVAVLIAAGAGRRRLSRELGVTEHEARQLLDRARTTPPAAQNADAPGAPSSTDPATDPAAAKAVLPAPSGASS